jgi:hypothetical protein
LKPQIVHSLANAELYCLGLANIYSDPNYHNLNHWGIIQALARKGVLVAEPPDAQLTETVLIQTTPIKLVSNDRHLPTDQAVSVLYLVYWKSTYVCSFLYSLKIKKQNMKYVKICELSKHQKLQAQQHNVISQRTSVIRCSLNSVQSSALHDIKKRNVVFSSLIQTNFLYKSS